MTIDIKAQLKLLRELQEIDLHLGDTEEVLSSIPSQIEEARSELEGLSAELKAKEAEKAQVEKGRRGLEMELEDSETHLREREGRLYAIKTNKEYQAALKEIADGKRANREREDAILKLMEKVDTLSKEIEQLSGRVVEKEGEFKKEEEELKKSGEELKKEMELRAAELKKVKEVVEKSALDRYNFIRTRYRDPLAAIEAGICQGCNMNIPPQMYIELLRGLRFHFCPSCHRFVYVNEEKEGKENQAGKLQP